MIIQILVDNRYRYSLAILNERSGEVLISAFDVREGVSHRMLVQNGNSTLPRELLESVWSVRLYLDKAGDAT